MLKWARTNLDQFYGQFAGKAPGLLVKREDQRTEDEEAERHHSAQRDKLGSLLEKATADFRAKLVRNLPETVQDRARGTVANWRRWAGVDMTTKAEAELGHALTTIVQDMILAQRDSQRLRRQQREPVGRPSSNDRSYRW